MMDRNPELDRPLARRTVLKSALKGFGAAVALPMFDSLAPLAGATRGLARAATDVAGAAAAAPPNRMAFIYVPNGMHMQDWTPATAGAEFELPATLKLIERHRQDFLILSGLTQDKARANGDGGGDHARGASAFLTGCQPHKTHGANIRAGLSVDQAAAEHVGHFTRLASLEIGCEKGMYAGNCDSGYSCAYSANISWRSASQPMTKEVNPRLVFERLFGGEHAGESAEARAERHATRQSILDYVREDARQLHARLGGTDQRKLDEYLSAVREVERRIERAEQFSQRELPAVPQPEGTPKEYPEHLRLMYDLMALAFQADITRVITFLAANEGSNRPYRFLDVPQGHHELSHHGDDPEKQAKIAKINRFHIEEFGRFLDRLKALPEGSGNLLDNAMIVIGSGIGDGNAHNHDNLPILLAGRGCGTVSPGRHVQYDSQTPLNNLWLSMLARMDADREKLGDSTGHLGSLLV